MGQPRGQHRVVGFRRHVAQRVAVRVAERVGGENVAEIPPTVAVWSGIGFATIGALLVGVGVLPTGSPSTLN